ncbi:GNAT family N-acetyltransferase [Bifidobacterium gallicum]|uniref:Acetyltransferase, GNAT family n=1 Tax=Bifidobacterium gallicum DSM 20093 = LMG 11596 TaxID=561180 RepID=D1NU29_9BIFI|nr:GNAT family N-acetyltransferase [Bifidobacterium gallicum]EFA23233.1 acetyltransferase, GNAT family [Bifidobacterium gallicum DSM 20093 = LMG 11596]KFI58894.1 putative acetyltransferase [Bifidobacterium gallicum DSM 20093 = LMG 11596]
MQIRLATSADIDQLTALRMDYMHAEHGALTDEQQRTMEQAVPQFILDHLGDDLYIYVAQDEDGTIASTAWLLTEEKPPRPEFPTGRVGEVFNMLTRPEYRGRGIAKQVMQRLVDDATQTLDCEAVRLNATPAGQHVYAAIGFKKREPGLRAMFYTKLDQS